MSNPPALPFRILKKWRPLDIPYDPSLIRTGDCLVRIGLGTVNGTKLTAHILPEKYATLKAACPGVDPPKLKHKIPKDIEKTWDDIHGKTKFVTPRSHAEHVPDLSWICPANLEKFNPDKWEINKFKWYWLPTRNPTFSTEEFDNPEPTPPTGSELYPFIFLSKTVDSPELFIPPRIPNIRKKTAARTEKGRERFAAKMKQIWSDRKLVYKYGKDLLRNAGFFKHSKDVLGQVDARISCPRCGCNVFVPKGRKNMKATFPPATVHEKLTCYDCGYVPRERTYRIKSADNKTEGNEGLHCDDGRNPPLLRLTPREFVAALLIDGRLGDIADVEERRKISSSYLQLCEGWLPADVQKESGFDGEGESAIRQRAARLLRVLLEHKQAKKPLPKPSAEEIAYLNENMDVTEIVT